MSSSSLLSFPAVMFDKNDSAKFTTQKNRSALKMNRLGFTPKGWVQRVPFKALMK